MLPNSIALRPMTVEHAWPNVVLPLAAAPQEISKLLRNIPIA
jgi:hypothetical protein